MVEVFKGCRDSRRIALVRLQGERFDLREWCAERGASPWLLRTVIRVQLNEAKRIRSQIK